MIEGLLGRLFRAIAGLRPSEGSEDLRHVGDELVRLEQRSGQRPTSSR